MSEPTSSPARPVSVITILFVLALFMVVYVVVRRYYHATSVAAFNAPAENLSKDFQWKATHETRRDTLVDLKKAQAEQGATYGWVDQKAGVVRLSIDRAIELTAEKYGKKK
jgi:hypothetical protein